MAIQYADPADFGASPSLSDNSAAFNAAFAASPVVSCQPGLIYKIAAPLTMLPGQRLIGASITQGNGVNLKNFISMAAGCELDHVMIDGNRANNGGIGNTDTIMVKAYGSADDVKIHDCTMTGSPGGCIAIANSRRAFVRGNTLKDSIGYGVLLFGTTPNFRGSHTVSDNTMIGPFLHTLQIEQCDGNLISGNKLLGVQAVGGVASPMRVNISGNTATWVSGPNFANLSLGNVLVANGQEFPITNVVSATQLTLSLSASMTNAVAAIGGGDVLSITSSLWNTIANNFVSGGVTGGIVLSQCGGFMTPAADVLGNTIMGNFIEYSGNFGIALEAPTIPGGWQVGQTSIIGNTILAPNRNGSAGGAGLQLSAGAGLMPDIIVSENIFYDPFTTPGGYWVTGSGQPNAAVSFGLNTVRGFANGSARGGY